MIIASPALLVVGLPCAFLWGFSVSRGGTCAVAAAKQLVYERHGTLLIGFAIAVGASGLISLPLAWIFGNDIHLARDAVISPALIVGAVLLGVGAVINDACLFGTLSRVSLGEVRFLALPAGLAAGFALSDRQSLLRPAPGHLNVLMHPSHTGLLAIVVFALLLGVGWILLGSRRPVPDATGWPLRLSMVLMGACGAFLFLLVPGWTYADAVWRGVSPGAAMAMAGGSAVLVGAVAVGGAIVSSVAGGAFCYRRPTPVTVLRSFAGGAVMAMGAAMIPGGNDSLLLAAVPAATISGITAFAVMSVTVPLLLVAQRRRHILPSQ